MGVEGDEIDCPIPDVPEELAWVWRCWWRLTDSRPWLSGMSAAIPLPIGFRDLLQWSEYYDYDEDMFHQLTEIVRVMDGVYISHMQQKAKA